MYTAVGIVLLVFVQSLQLAHQYEYELDKPHYFQLIC
jgi:hypothetical protein